MHIQLQPMQVQYFFCFQWGSLSHEEKAIYFAEADLHKLFHQLDNPGWTTKENYVSTCRPPIFKLEKDEMLLYHEVEHILHSLSHPCVIHIMPGTEEVTVVTQVRMCGWGLTYSMAHHLS